MPLAIVHEQNKVDYIDALVETRETGDIGIFRKFMEGEYTLMLKNEVNAYKQMQEGKGNKGDHPGQLITEELNKRGIKQSVFAMEAGIYPSQLSEIVRGKKSITANIAVKLENRLGIPAEYWLLLNMDYQLQKVRYGTDDPYPTIESDQNK